MKIRKFFNFPRIKSGEMRKAREHIQIWAALTPLVVADLTTAAAAAQDGVPTQTLITIGTDYLAVSGCKRGAGRYQRRSDRLCGKHFNTFFTDNEYFKHIEVGWTSSQDRIYLDNVHVTAWHADQRDAAGVPDGWAIDFSAAKFLNEKWMPFLRPGYADDGGALWEGSVMLAADQTCA